MMPMRTPFPVPPHARALRGAIIGASLVLLAACGGGGGGSTTPTGSGGGGGTQDSFYLSGISGVDRGGGLSLTGSDATGAVVSIPSANLFSTVASIPPNQGTVAQWTAASGTATALGTRYRVWAGTDGNLYDTDLLVVAGASAPTTAVLSTFSTSSICAPPTVLDDLATPAHSALVFRDKQHCTVAPSDQFIVVPLSASASTAPGTSSLLEPVDVARDATGAIKQVLFIDHAAGKVAVGSDFSSAPTPVGTLNGSGINVAGNGGDFASLGVITQADGSQVWLYRDLNTLNAVDLKTLAPAVTVYTAADSDTIQLPVVVDGTDVFVAMTDSTNPVGGPYTCQLVRIDTRAPLSASSGQFVVQENTTGPGLTIVGVAGANLIYFNNNVSGGAGSVILESIAKTATRVLASNIPSTLIATAPAPMTFGDSSFGRTSSAITVGSGVYYTLSTPSNVGLSALQAYFYSGPGSPVPIGNGSVLLGGVAASPVSTANPAAPAYGSALLALEPLGGGLPATIIASYDASGNAIANLGALPTLNEDTYTGLTLSESPLQAGMPALLVVGGQHNNNFAQDLFKITPGTAGSLHQVTSNLQ
jgi:hypothetical protein